MDRLQDPAGPGARAGAVVPAHQNARLRRVSQDPGAAHRHLQQHGVRRCRRHHRLLPRQLRAEARSLLRLHARGGRQQPEDRLAGCARAEGHHHVQEPRERLDHEHQQLAVLRGRPLESEARRLSGLHVEQGRESARSARGGSAEQYPGRDPRFAHRRRLRCAPHRIRGAAAAAARRLRRPAGGRSAQAKPAGTDRRLEKLGPAHRRRFRRHRGGDLLGAGSRRAQERSGRARPSSRFTTTWSPGSTTRSGSRRCPQRSTGSRAISDAGRRRGATSTASSASTTASARVSTMPTRAWRWDLRPRSGGHSPPSTQ